MLSNGIDSFRDENIRCSTDCLTAFLGAKDTILSTFKQHPELQSNPYPEIYGFPARPACDNPVYKAIEFENLISFGSELAEETFWEFMSEGREADQSLYAQSYALIDMACYLVYLLNIYMAHKSLILTLISAPAKVDALGREDYSNALAAIGKLIRKSVGTEAPLVIQQAVHLAIVAKYDQIVQNQSRNLPPGIDFERECEEKLVSGGFEVQSTPASGDFGADLIALKDGLGFAIQCKDTSKPVGVKAVQEAVGARSHYQVDFAVVCAVADFTDAAVELATSNKVILCNLSQLAARLDGI